MSMKDKKKRSMITIEVSNFSELSQKVLAMERLGWKECVAAPRSWATPMWRLWLAKIDLRGEEWTFMTRC